MQLPIDQVLPELVHTLRHARSVVLKAPPGSGKSTRVPGAILDAGLAGGGQIWMLEPRRVAARATALRIASERQGTIGQEVGYRVRFDDRSSAATKILVVTEGIVTRRFASDPWLLGTNCLILDEFHERSLHTDLALAFARELLAAREDFRLVVMSATLDTGPLTSYLDDCPVVTCEARAHPLRIQHLGRRDTRPLELQVRSALFELMRADDDDDGDILVFLPGAYEIRNVEALLAEQRDRTWDIVPLFGALPPEQQDRALTKGPRRRVILTTNIAETSLTVPSVTAVVDSGLEKRVRHHPKTGVDELELGSISKESAEQRAGRAGRTRPGRAFRLWTHAEHQQMHDRREPEVVRIDAAPMLLQTTAFQPGNPTTFPFYTKPPSASLESGRSLLERLGLIETESNLTRLTALGQRVASTPLHPRLGVLLQTGIELGVVRHAATIAALLEERDILLQREWGSASASSESCDLLLRKWHFEAVANESFRAEAGRHFHVDVRAARQVAAVRDQLLRLLGYVDATDENEASHMHVRLLLSAFPDRVCRRVARGAREAKMVGGRGVQLARESRTLEGTLLIATKLEGTPNSPRSLVRMATEIERDDLETVLPQHISEDLSADFDEERRAVVGRRIVRFADLVLEEKTGFTVPAALVEARFREEVRRHWQSLFQPSAEAQRWIDRVRFAAAFAPAEPWPSLDEAWIVEVLQSHAAGKRAIDDLIRIDWLQELRNALPWETSQLLESEFPDAIEVPSGSRIRIDYAAGLGPARAPILAVRLQEIFGMKKTPKIARGRIPLLLHLLGPNHRPVQITSDLTSFWRSAYAEVRKELRQRYPKHAWPEDPLTATAESRPRRKRPTST